MFFCDVLNNSSTTRNADDATTKSVRRLETEQQITFRNYCLWLLSFVVWIFVCIAIIATPFPRTIKDWRQVGRNTYALGLPSTDTCICRLLISDSLCFLHFMRHPQIFDNPIVGDAFTFKPSSRFPRHLVLAYLFYLFVSCNNVAFRTPFDKQMLHINISQIHIVCVAFSLSHNVHGICVVLTGTHNTSRSSVGFFKLRTHSTSQADCFNQFNNRLLTPRLELSMMMMM